MVFLFSILLSILAPELSLGVSATRVGCSEPITELHRGSPVVA